MRSQRKTRIIKPSLEVLERRDLLTTLIALVDTGVPLSGPYSQYYDMDRAYNSYDQQLASQYGPQVVEDAYGHGTTLTTLAGQGLEAAKGQPGAGGVDVRILPIKYMNAQNAYTSGSIVRGIYYAADQGAAVINVSVGAGGNFGDLGGPTVSQAIQYAESKGCVVVTAAGNQRYGLDPQGVNLDADPASPVTMIPAMSDDPVRNGLGVALTNVLVASAVNADGSLTWKSNWGSIHVDLGAYTSSGLETSHAAGYTSGVAGVIAALTPGATPPQRIGIIKSTVTPRTQSVGSWCTSGGVINPAGAVQKALTPAVPTGLSATAVSSSQINLAWNAAAGATGYTVERSPNGSTSWTTVGTPTGTSFQDSSLSPLTTYYYRIRANNAYGTSDPSATASATTQQSSASFPKKFDFGTPTSPVASGYTRVTAATAYTTGLGYGWTAGSGSDVDRGTGFGTDLTRDSFQTEGATFEVDVPNGTYDVTLVVGDSGPYSHDTQNFYLEGTLAASITTAQYEVKTEVHTVTVADGKLTIRIEDHNGNNWDTVLCALEIRPASATGQALGRAMTPTSTEIGFQASNAVNGDSSAYRSSGQWTRSDSIGWITGSTWVPVTTSPRSSSTGRSPTPRFSGFRSAMTRATGRRSSPSSPTSVVASRSTTAYQAEGATRASTAPLPARPTTLNSSARE